MEEIEDVTIMEEIEDVIWKKPEDVTIVEAMTSWFILTEQVFV